MSRVAAEGMAADSAEVLISISLVKSKKYFREK
jgi:hypothetical protein